MEHYCWAKCSACNFNDIYIYRNDYGFIQSCEICGTSLNGKAK
jgi:hypothetical protein